MTKKLKTNIAGWLMILSPLAGVLIFFAVPIAISVYLSFSDALYIQSGTLSEAKMVFFRQYQSILTDPLFWRALLNTFIAALSVPIQMVIGLFMAVLLNRLGTNTRKIFRALFFVPYVCSMVATVYMWQYIFEPTGFLNAIVKSCGGEPINFLTDAKYFMSCLIVMMVWSGIGYYSIMYQAALTNVNQSCLEAAELDGAGSVKKFVSITLPAISPTTFYLLIMGVINGLQVFTWFQIICANLGDGFLWGPENTGITVVYYIYQMAYINQFGMGGASRACAMSVVLVAIIALLTVINFALQKKWVHYET